MNQPPNTTEKSKCCGAKKKLILTTAEYNGDDENNGYWDACSNCGKPFIPSPSVCEVAKGAKVAHRRFCGKSGFNCAVYHLDGICPDVRDCEGCKAELSIPTEPKKTVENVCCQLGGFEHKIGLEYKGKVCTCTCHTPIQTGNDECKKGGMHVEFENQGFCKKCGDNYYDSDIQNEWAKEFDKQFFIMMADTGKGIKDNHKKISKDIKSFIRSSIQKAVLQERERNETKILGLETVIKGQEIMLESLLPLRRYN